MHDTTSLYESVRRDGHLTYVQSRYPPIVGMVCIKWQEGNSISGPHKIPALQQLQ